jgi:hypothetical protein
MSNKVINVYATKKGKEKTIELLGFFAQKKEIAQTNIEELTKTTYRNNIRYLDFLKARDYIKRSRIDPCEKQGAGRNIWEITFKGLVHALINAPKENIETILRAHPDKLLIAKKLPLFESIDIKDEVLDVLFEVLKGEVIRAIMLDKAGMKQIYPSDDAWENAIDSSVLITLFTVGVENLNPKKYMNFLKLCKDDTELNCCVKSYIDREVKKCQTIFQLKGAWERGLT